LNESIRIFCRLDVECATGSTSLCEFRNPFLRFAHHQMTIEKCLRIMFSQSGYNWWSNGDIVNEMTIHNVHMKPVRTERENVLRLSGEKSKVSGEKRGSDESGKRKSAPMRKSRGGRGRSRHGEEEERQRSSEEEEEKGDVRRDALFFACAQQRRLALSAFCRT